MSVQTKKKPPLDLALITTPAPLVWRVGIPTAMSETTSMMTCPNRRSASTIIGYSKAPATSAA